MPYEIDETRQTALDGDKVNKINEFHPFVSVVSPAGSYTYSANNVGAKLVIVNIGGKVFKDSNRNGIIELGDDGISGVKVSLEKLNTETNTYEAVVHPTSGATFVTSDDEGAYRFEEEWRLKSGQYKVLFNALDPKYYPTTLNVGSDYKIDSDISLLGVVENVEGADYHSEYINAGYVELNISGFVFKDTNIDGLFESAKDTVIPNSEVQLYKLEDDGSYTVVTKNLTSQDFVTTNAEGKYSFSHATGFKLDPTATYKVVLKDAVANYTGDADERITLQNKGDDEKIDSDAEISGENVASVFNVSPINESGSNVSFGIIDYTKADITITGADVVTSTGYLLSVYDKESNIVISSEVTKYQDLYTSYKWELTNVNQGTITGETTKEVTFNPEEVVAPDTTSTGLLTVTYTDIYGDTISKTIDLTVIRSSYKITIYQVIAGVETPATGAICDDEGVVENEISAQAGPAPLGYKFGSWTVEPAGVVLDDPSSQNVKFTMPLEDVVLKINWVTSGDTAYTVNHVKYNIDGSEGETETETFSNGHVGATATATDKNYTGFTAQKPLSSGVIVADGTLIITQYYTRNEYDLTFDMGYDGSTPIVSKTKFEDTITAPTTNPTRTGYVFGGWSPAIADDEKMPASDKTFTATWLDDTDKDGVADADQARVIYSDGTNTVYHEGYFNADETVTLVVGKNGLTIPSGKVFSGWSKTNGGTTAITEVTIPDPVVNVTVYAIFEGVNVSPTPDVDTDGDGLEDAKDPNPTNPDGDLDGDGIIDSEDDDIDGDGIENAKDKTPCGESLERPGYGSDNTCIFNGYCWILILLAILLLIAMLTKRRNNKKYLAKGGV